MTEQIPAIIDRTQIIGDGCTPVVPVLIAAAGHASGRNRRHGILGLCCGYSITRKPNTRTNPN
jgi:hypothetical protein